ncbi:uncharacterized protein LOC124265742, partial [Haliotis rubra]|uniref:uncharacterized protein LOC124265742 n=1 Tax=Haliotis rubra TaxID=36100 RepID=UPI001EE5FCD1
MDRHELLTCIIHIILVVMVPIKASKRSESCFIHQSTQVCSRHRLRCAGGYKIRINGTFYVAKSDTLKCLDLPLNCTSNNLPNCCKLARGDLNRHVFNTTESEKIKSLCSNKAYCEFPAPRTPSLIFSVVTYDCIEGETTGIDVGVAIAVAVVTIYGILIVIFLCYLEK